MVRQLHDGITAGVTNDGFVSEAFAVNNGGKQGCVPAPALISHILSAMSMDAYRDELPDIGVAYRAYGSLLIQRRMQVQWLVSTTIIHALLFADDCALNTTLEGNMQRSMDLFSAACDNFGLIMNTEKMVVIHQTPPNTDPPPQCAADQCEQNRTASGGQFHVSEQHPFPQHQNR
nr:unnamed protein product [Spirometra erinaceieuropaei]